MANTIKCLYNSEDLNTINKREKKGVEFLMLVYMTKIKL